MANSERTDRRLVEKLKSKFRLIIINDSTFEERFSMKLSRLNVIAVVASAAFLIALVTIAVIVYTPARELIPGYSDSKAKARADVAFKKAQVLEAEVLKTQAYLDNVKSLLKGEIRAEEIPYDSTGSYGEVGASSIDFSISEKDSLLRATVAAEEKYTLKFDRESGSSRIDALSTMVFFTPLRGTVSSAFSIGTDHLGTDIVAPDDEPVKSCLDGTVTFASWTASEGHVIMVQHPDDLLSVYKHNSVLHKKVGDAVKAGESIAIIGDTGELSDGPHLHFELWHRGAALDPEQYISFD